MRNMPVLIQEMVKIFSTKGRNLIVSDPQSDNNSSAKPRDEIFKTVAINFHDTAFSSRSVDLLTSWIAPITRAHFRGQCSQQNAS